MMDSKTSAGLRPPTTKKRRRVAPTTIDALGNDVLCMIFSFIDLVQLIRCSAVCKSWGAVINKLKLLQIQYHKQQQTKSGSSLDAPSFSERLINIQMEQLAMERQRLSLQEGAIDIFQWKAHSVGKMENTSNVNTSNTENEWRELAKDPKRKAKSKDPGWKYAFYPNLGNKDVVKCVLCGNENHGGINRFKQHLIGGYPDIHKCPKTSREIAGVMSEYIATTRSKKRNKAAVQLDIIDDEDDEVQEIGSTEASNTAPRCSKNKPFGFEPKVSKSIGSMVMRTPEQVIEDRHAKEIKSPLDCTFEFSHQDDFA
ncbi:hypothetical protein OROHE_004683 [Orobanche hederae]